MLKTSGRSLAEDLRALLIPNPVLALLLLSVASILVAIFIFGDERPGLSELFRTVGIGALAAAVTGIIDHNLLFRNFETRIHESLLAANGTSATLTELGIETAYRQFGFSQIFKDAKQGETVCWLDTYCPVQNEFLEELESAMRRKVTIRMLVIDPECENARARNHELSGTLETGKAFMDSLKLFVTKMELIAAHSSGRLEVRYYSDLPCVPMYLIGKHGQPRKAFFSIFLSKPTAHCSHVELSSGEWLTNMASYFDRKWEHWDPKHHGAGHQGGPA